MGLGRDLAKVVPCANTFALCFGDLLCSSAPARSASACVRDDVNTATCDFLWVFPSWFWLFFSFLFSLVVFFIISGAMDISKQTL